MGPLPLNLRMEPGDRTLEQLVASTERGLLVTRFHYTNVVSEKETVLTGMTRDGTFAIDEQKTNGDTVKVNGKVAAGGSANGTFELRTTAGGIACDTGSVNWTARH